MERLLKKIFGFMLFFVILPAFSYADIPQSDIQNQKDRTCTCPKDIDGIKNMASKCMLYGDQCEVVECEQDACVGFYKKITCVPLGTEVLKDANGFCDTGQCECAEDSNADLCAWSNGFCEPRICASSYTKSNGRCIKDRRIMISNDSMHDKKTNSNEYTIDQREYVAWGNGLCPPPYDRLLRMDMASICTAEYIAPNIILTAQHCVVDDNNDIIVGRKIKYLDCKGNTVWASIKSYGDNAIYKGKFNRWGEHSVPVDWALLSVDNPEFYSSAMFGLEDVSGQHDITVDNAGWGAMPILSDKQIQELRKSFTEFAAEQNGFADFYKFDELFIDTWDGDNLKAHKNCTLHTYFKYDNKQDFHSSTCYTWGGNSGGPYYVNNKVIGIVSGGVRNLPDQDVSDLIVSTVQYMSQEQKNCDKVAEAKWENNVCVCKDADKVWQYNKCECTQEGYVIGTNGKCEPAQQPVSPEQKHCENDVAKGSGATWDGSQCVCSVAGTSWNGEKCICPNHDETVQDGVCKTSPKKQELDEAKEEIVDNCFNQQKLKSMSDYEFFDCLGQMAKIQQLQKAYEEAKAREQSLANRTLTALTIAATGIGGMELARGLAEQKADKEAEQDMEAYIATMRCTYGDGKSVKAGTTEIELPGANDPEMMKLRNEYFALAASLKERKEALGMKPGIENEVILDKAQMGLYDDESTGITGGAYASLYRAKMGSETDQSKIDEDKDASKKRVIAGGVLTGTGVVGGTVGNSMINGKLGEMIKDKKDKKSNSKSNQSVIDKLRKGLKSTGMTNVDKLDFSGLDLSSMSGVIDKIDFSSMSGLSGKNALDVLNTSNGSSFTSSFSSILGGQKF